MDYGETPFIEDALYNNINVINIKKDDFSKNINGYSIKLSFVEQKLTMIIYDIENLDGKQYKKILTLNELYSLNKNLQIIYSIEQLFDDLKKLIEENKCTLEKNENSIIFSFVITDIHNEKNQIKISLIENNNKVLDKNYESNEYIGILSNEIKSLRENQKIINELKEENKSIKSEIVNLKEIINNRIKEDTNINNIYSCIIELNFNDKKRGNEILKNLSENELTELKILKLRDNNIDDINGLQSLKIENLEQLQLHKNKISDISPFDKVNFKKLKKLRLDSNEIVNINIFENVNFENLESLNLGNNKISDINILKKVKFKKLKELILTLNEIEDITPLEYGHFPDLNTIYLDNNHIKDINVLEKVNFKELQLLNLGGNEITDINCLIKTNFEKLEQLGLNNNKIVNIESITKFKYKELKELYLDHNSITDITPLQYIKTKSLFAFGFFGSSLFEKLEILKINDNNIEITDYNSIIEGLKTKIDDFEY
jgi:Leucine-rich repeat (LRR) protein